MYILSSSYFFIKQHCGWLFQVSSSVAVPLCASVVFHRWCLFCQYVFLFSPSFGTSGRLCFVIVAFRSPEVIKLFSCSTAEHEISLGHKNKNTKNLKLFSCSTQLSLLSWAWAWKKFQNFVSILRFINKTNFMLSWVEYDKSFIKTLGSGYLHLYFYS